MASMEFLSSCWPQENAQSPPPMAHAPTPMGVICRAELPSCRVCIAFLMIAEEERFPWPAIFALRRCGSILQDGKPDKLFAHGVGRCATRFLLRRVSARDRTVEEQLAFTRVASEGCSPLKLDARFVK